MARTEQDRSFKGIWIPKALYLDPALSWTEKILVLEIDSLDKGDGCWASNSYLSKHLELNVGTVANLITKLRKQGILETKSFDGRTRHIVLSEEFKVSYFYESSLNKNINPGTRDTLYKRFKQRLPRDKRKRKNTNIQIYIPLAQRLSHTIRTHKNVKVPQTRIVQWAKELQKLETQDGVTLPRQLAVLKWYQNNYGGEYVPVAESGSTFRAKFLRIEDAMKREEKKGKKSCMRCPQGLDWGSYAKPRCDASGCPQGERCYAKRQAGPNPL